MPSSGSGKEDVLQQVNQFWTMLDDLCRDDPEAYRKFIDKQMKEGAEFNAAPELHSCICTDILEPNRGLLYINLCSWKRVPAPQHPGKPLPLCAGKLETEDKGGQGPYSVLDVAVNPRLLKECKPSKTEMNQLYMLLLNFVQQEHNLKLSQQYTPVSPRSTTQDLYHRLGFQQWPTCQTPASLLQKISSLHTEKEEEILVAPKPAEPKKNNLIQVISSTLVQPQRPKYLLEVRPDAAGAPRCVDLTVELPKVSNMSECQLRISKDDVLLEVEDVYHLLLDFPNLVDEDSATAVFNKKKRQLTMRVNIL
uniref:PIH1 domain-containing protein 2 n=1 Tax=Periophthalmus magnuspinnatus TaxID=409849 RepID=A0A3B4ABJ6_9GOBI